jgi:hypothetical protein
MKQRNVTISGYLLLFLFCIMSCSKKASNIPPPEPEIAPDSQLVSFFQDQLFVLTQVNTLTLLANEAVATVDVVTGEPAVPFNAPCDATMSISIDTTFSAVFIHFDGSDCGGAYIRRGSIAMIVPGLVQWKNRDVETRLIFNNIEITRKSDGIKMTLSGSAAYANLTGGLLHTLSPGDSLSLLFEPDDLWLQFENYERKALLGGKRMTYKVANDLQITVEGVSEVNRLHNVIAHGEDKNGDMFVMSVEAPLIFSESCDYRLTGGQLSYEAVGMNGNVTFGVNEDGDPSPCPGQGNPYYFEVDWQRATDPERLQTTIPYAF